MDHDRGDVVGTTPGQGEIDERGDRADRGPALAEDGGDLGVGELAAEAVGTEEEDVALPDVDDAGVDLDALVGADGAGDHVAPGEGGHVFRAEEALLDEVVGERVVAGHLLQRAVAEAVHPAVAHVGDHRAPLHEVEPDEGGPHPAPPPVLAGLPVDVAVGPVEPGDEAARPRLRAAEGAVRWPGGLPVLHGALDVLDHRARGDLAGGGAAHAVGDHEEAQVGDHGEGVLVGRADEAEIALAVGRQREGRVGVDRLDDGVIFLHGRDRSGHGILLVAGSVPAGGHRAIAAPRAASDELSTA